MPNCMTIDLYKFGIICASYHQGAKLLLITVNKNMPNKEEEKNNSHKSI